MKIKERIYVIVGIVMGMILSTTISYLLAETLINSKDVTYEDNAGLGATNVQAAIDGTCTKFSNQLTNLQTTILNKVYPVGSIFISTSNTNPGTLFGGTWEAYGNGKVLRGTTSTSGQTGGSENVTLSVANLPSHNHSIPSLTGTATGGNHRHLLTKNVYNVDVTGSRSVSVGTGYAGVFFDGTYYSDYSGDLSLSVSTNASKTGATGTATSFSVLDPYITVFMWRRTK